MNPDLSAFLASGKLLAEGTTKWGDMPLEIACYQNAEQPPAQYVSSVRAIVFRGDKVLVVDNGKNEFYITPGGRCEKGESIEETLRRELLEETGWTLKDNRPLGFMHFHHLGPKPAGYAYPYPDFIWLIYTAQADKHFPKATIADEYVHGVEFHPIAEALAMDIEPGELALLKAAINIRQNEG
ncbi:MAG: NUDIX hydrolase [Chloroflexi bacterium]|nr:NUDIX hydrolase [Chloroflexota bacterium]